MLSLTELSGGTSDGFLFFKYIWVGFRSFVGEHDIRAPRPHLASCMISIVCVFACFRVPKVFEEKFESGAYDRDFSCVGWICLTDFDIGARTV